MRNSEFSFFFLAHSKASEFRITHSEFRIQKSDPKVAFFHAARRVSTHSTTRCAGYSPYPTQAGSFNFHGQRHSMKGRDRIARPCSRSQGCRRVFSSRTGVDNLSPKKLVTAPEPLPQYRQKATITAASALRLFLAA